MFDGAMERAEIRAVRHEDRDWLVERHQTLYARDEGFDDTFGPLVAEIVDDFLAAHDPSAEAGWIATLADARCGSIFCVRQGPYTAKLRLFLLEPEMRGIGLGTRLLHTCMQFAQSVGYRDMQLWTHESHEAACALYRRAGWQLVSSKPVFSFGQHLVEQGWCYRF